MNRRFFLILAAISLAIVGSLLPRHAAAAEVSFSFFYDNLSPYGTWIDVEGYGTCWQPYAIEDEWAPYTDGSWAYTDAGWTWVSNEDFGEIVYHYGRWVSLEGLGWIWRPDTEWGPAWVSWRSSDDYIGWAPLPPEVPLGVGIGISGWFDDSFLGPLSYSFCLVEDFGAPRLRHVLFRRERNASILYSTTNITHITVNNVTKIVYNRGPDYRRVSQRSKRRIERLQLDRRTSASDYRRGGRAVRSGGKLVVHAPRVKKDSRPAPKASKKWSNTKVDRGWKGVNTTERNRWEAKVRDEKRQREARQSSSQRRAPGSSSAVSAPAHHPRSGRTESRPSSPRTVERGNQGRGSAPARTSSDRAKQMERARQQQEQSRKQQEQSRKQQEDARKRQAETRKRQEDARRKQQEDARKRQEQARKQQEQARKKQQEQARKKQQETRKKQEKARATRQMEQQRRSSSSREAPRRQESRSSSSQRSKPKSSSQSRDRGKQQDRKKESKGKDRDKKRDKKRR